MDTTRAMSFWFQTPTEKKDYLNPRKVMESKTGDIEITCYHNGLYWVCPNPFNKSKAEGIKEACNNEYYIDHQKFKITRENFDDHTFWNS